MRSKAVREATSDHRGGRVLLAEALLLLLVAAAGCGSEAPAEKPPPPQPIQLNAVITPGDVDVEPTEVRTGPVVITVSNRDDRSHTVSLTGDRVREEVGPINPLDTATLQKSLAEEGVYLVRAGSPEAAREEMAPARIVVSRNRQSDREDVQVR